MSKVLTSPVKKWPGTITIPDYLTIPQAMAWEEAFDNARSLLPECEPFKTGEKLTVKQIETINDQTSSKWANAILPGILACVESWNLEGFDPNKFPATPKTSRVILITWILGEITKLYNEAEEVPNE